MLMPRRLMTSPRGRKNPLMERWRRVANRQAQMASNSPTTTAMAAQFRIYSHIS